MRVTEVMRTSFATVKPNALLLDAVQLLLDNNQRGLPVLDDNGRIVGIISEGDLLHRDELGVSPRANWIEALLGIEESGTVRERMRTLRVAAAMTPDPVCVDEDATIDDVIALMDMRAVAQLPVVHADKVIGMISRYELIGALERALRLNGHARMAPKAPAATTMDESRRA